MGIELYASPARRAPNVPALKKQRSVAPRDGDVQKKTAIFSELAGTVQEGEITSWKEKWGWIRCFNAEGGDLFAHESDLDAGVAPALGMRVSFLVGRDEKTDRWR